MDVLPHAWHLDLHEIDYTDARALQEKIVAHRIYGSIPNDVILFLEHPPVFTMGRRGGLHNLRVNKTFLKKKHVALHHVERGGDITYHGPGQLVVYAVINLAQSKLSVVDFVTKIEEVMIRTASDYDVTASRNELNRGIWVGGNKLGSIGIAVRHGVTFHGMALNAKMDLTPFSWITPCGLANVGVTSMENETDVPLSMPQIKASVQKHWQSVFNVEFKSMTLSDMPAPLKTTGE